MNRLDELINKTNNVYNTKKNISKDKMNDIVSEIKKKFPKLKHYDFRSSNDIKLNEMIRYVDKNLKKMSIVGIITKIEHFSILNDESDVKTIYLYSPFIETSWSVNSEKVYLFKLHKLSKKRKLMDELMDNYAEQVDKYLKKNNVEK